MMSAQCFRISLVTFVSMGAVMLGTVSARAPESLAGSVMAATAPEQRTLLAQRAAYDPLIRQIQHGLNALGYNAGPEDGLMGGRTRSAIAAYQRKHDLLVTGQASRSLLDHIEARRTEGGTEAATAQAELITNIQVQLRALGYDVRVTGRLDAATQEAIQSYQREHQLLVTGEPSSALLDRLEKTVGEQRELHKELVAQIQSALRRRGYDIDVVSGRMDALTEKAIRSYQRSRGLLVTGEPSRELLTLLEEGQTQDAQLSRREQIRRIQEALNARGYEAGPADGAMGPKTRSAVRTYQSDAGMPVTGQISPELLARLDITDVAGAETGATGTQTIQPKETQAGQPTFKVRVSDDFSDGDYTNSPSWTVLAGDFRVESGKLASTVRPSTIDNPEELGKALLRGVLDAALGVRLPGRQGAAAAALPTRIGKVFQITATLSGSGGDGRALVNLGTYQGNDAANGYRLVFDEQAGRQLKLLASTETGVSTVAATRAVSSLMDGNLHTVEWVRDAAGQMTVSVDGTIVMEASDQTYEHDFDGFSFINGGGTWRLDSLAVYGPEMP